MSPSRWKRLANRLLGLALALIAIELLIRQIYVAQIVLDPVQGAIFKPGSTTISAREGYAVSHWLANSVRMLRPDPHLPRILVLGDSFTEAIMSGDEDVYTARLERKLHDAAVNVSVVNSGRSGASSADYVAFAPKYLREFHPQWTIIQLRDPDLTDDAWDPRKPYFVQQNGALTPVVPQRRYGRPSQLLQAMHDRSMALAYAIRYRLTDFMEQFGSEPPLFRAGSVAAQQRKAVDPATYPVREELEMMRRAYGGRVTFLYLPELDFLHPAQRTATERMFDAYCRDSGASCVSARDEYPRLVKAGVSPFGFSNTRFNFGHMNDHGQQLSAEVLFREMENLHRRGLL